MHECSIERQVMKNACINHVDSYRDLLNELNITIINDWETIKLLREQNEKLKEQVPKWIPCTMRLPESDDKVLCQTVTKKGAVNFVIGYHMDGRWCCGMNSNVVAWMPLPEPYKGEQA